ncbi:lrgB-like family protein [[Clostridium] sordellii ATCC 9714]|nr:lrgB-like family protein [[Clostridium] sordellii ATCC 9714] [Paeniclostridium sordellii ATCC 9714]
MYNVLQTPVFGIVVTILFFNLGLYIQKKTKLAIFNPLLIAILAIIVFLKICNIPYESYKSGGDTINFFLAPVTIVLALPLYKQYNLLKNIFMKL